MFNTWYGLEIAAGVSDSGRLRRLCIWHKDKETNQDAKFPSLERTLIFADLALRRVNIVNTFLLVLVRLYLSACVSCEYDAWHRRERLVSEGWKWEDENEATVACMGQGSCGVVMKLLCCSYRTFLRSQKWIPRQSFRECLCGEVFVHAFIKFLFIFLIHLWAKKQHIKVSQFEMCPETHLDDGFRGISSPVCRLGLLWVHLR